MLSYIKSIAKSVAEKHPLIAGGAMLVGLVSVAGTALNIIKPSTSTSQPLPTSSAGGGS